MVDREVFDRRMAALEELLRRLRGLGARDRAAFAGDAMLQASAERWLHLAAESALDLAHHLIADRGWKTPSSYREAFQVLAQEGVLLPELARQMEAWAGLRNVLVHFYLEVDHDRLFEILQRDLDQLQAYAAAVSEAVAADDDSP